MSISRFIRYRDASGSTAWGLVDGTTVRQLTAAPYLDHRPTGHTALLADVTLLAPAEPPKIFHRPQLQKPSRHQATTRATGGFLQAHHVPAKPRWTHRDSSCL